MPVLFRELEDDLGRARGGTQHGEERAGREQQCEGVARVGLDAVVGEERRGDLDHAKEAFASVLQMDKDFDKANEILLFRLGIIYKQQGKYTESLECFDRILRNPPSPLAPADIWFQIGHVYEQQKDHTRANDAYEHVVQENPLHAKVLQQLGWLYRRTVYHNVGSSPSGRTPDGIRKHSGPACDSYW
ncbi:hypothetical protein DFH11DRAFT_1830567 [Phellopilus nigrolimitatus]|nr:hypothetical protein DFH11DRAFT_1830567 [Phellopilus nigrolimitatus]